MAFIYDLTDTWNAGGTTFSAIKMNVTDTASASASKLVQCQISGTDKFTVGKDGGGYFAGSVGIGTSSPAYKLDVSGAINIAAGNYFRSGSAFLMASDGSTTNYAYTGSSQLVWRNGADSAELMRLTNAGNVGIGTSSPSAKLTVSSGDILLSNAYSIKGRNAANTLSIGMLRRNASDQVAIDEDGYGTVIGFGGVLGVFGSGNVGIGTSSPGAKLDVRESSTGRSWSPTAGITTALIERAGFAGLTIAGTTGVNYLNFASASDENVGNIGYDLTNNAMTFRTNGAGEDMRITSAGDVGIGTSSPGAKLQVGGSTAASQLRIYGGNAGSTSPELQFYGASSDHNWTLVGNHSAALTFNKGTFGSVGSELMRITSTGDLLVGTTTTGGITDGSSTNEGTQVGSGSIRSQRNGAAGLFLSKSSGYASSVLAQFYVSGSSVGTITTTGSATAYNTSSDARLKENIADADDASSLIDAIQVRKFDWKADGSHQRYGMVAQELLEVAPEAVSGEPEGEDMMGVDYSKLVPMLIKEIQSLRARVAQLEG